LNTVQDFASKPHPRKWGRLALMRAFNIDECTPALDSAAVMETFAAFKDIRDLA
jgi:hypothetical protein